MQRYRERAEAAGLTWPLPEELTEGEIEARLFPPPPPPRTPRPLPEWKDIDQELRRKGVTLQLLWEERGGTSGCPQLQPVLRALPRVEGSLDVVLRQEHMAGERTFVDYAGQTMPLVDQDTSELREVLLRLSACDWIRRSQIVLITADRPRIP